MCWVAADRGHRLASLPGDGELALRWAAAADEMKAESLDKGVDERGVFVQHYGATALDASLLLVPVVRFLPPDDPRVRATVLAISHELTEEARHRASRGARWWPPPAAGSSARGAPPANSHGRSPPSGERPRWSEDDSRG